MSSAPHMTPRLGSRRSKKPMQAQSRVGGAMVGAIVPAARSRSSPYAAGADAGRPTQQTQRTNLRKGQLFTAPKLACLVLNVPFFESLVGLFLRLVGRVRGVMASVPP